MKLKKVILAKVKKSIACYDWKDRWDEISEVDVLTKRVLVNYHQVNEKFVVSGVKCCAELLVSKQALNKVLSWPGG